MPTEKMYRTRAGITMFVPWMKMDHRRKKNVQEGLFSMRTIKTSCKGKIGVPREKSKTVFKLKRDIEKGHLKGKSKGKIEKKN